MPKTETKTVIVKDEYDDDEEFELQDELQQENMMDEDTEDEAPNNSSDQSRRGSASQVLPDVYIVAQPTRLVTVAATQMSCTNDVEKNISNAEKLVREAASKGAQIILLQELFERLYFCQTQDYENINYATTVDKNPAIKHFKRIARELSVVLPISFYERSGNARFNSVAIIDADGSILGLYRKSHIPDGPGYSEKFYFSPGDTGFKVFKTRYATIGIGICWDQWFPECARAMALKGAELLLYPTAIGSEPQDPTLDSKDHWQICMRGHAAANLVPVIASNRVGVERIGESSITFYGSSFICDHKGSLVAEANRVDNAVLVATFDLDAIDRDRAYWGVFRDRRPNLYTPLLTLDGKTPAQHICQCDG